MLDASNSFKTDIKTPATGIIQKSNPKSFFLKMHQDSRLSDTIFEDNPSYNKKRVEVIQVMLINKDYMLVEIVYTEDGL